jgi:hypothetical protein
LPLLGAPTTTTLVGAGTLMHLKKGAIVAAIAVWALAGSAPWWLPVPQPAPANASASILQAAVHNATTGEVPEAAPMVVARHELPPPAPLVFELKGRCVDEHARPLAGCSVDLHGWFKNDDILTRYELDHGKVEWTDPPSQTTAADGCFAFTFVPPPPFQFSLSITAPGRVPVDGGFSDLPALGKKELGDLTLPTGHLVRGVLIDARGAPQPDEEIWIDQSPGFGVRAPAPRREPPPEVVPRTSYHARTDTRGRFVLATPLPSGTYNVKVNGRRMVSPSPIEIAADQPEQHLEIQVQTLADIPSITGVVVDEQGAREVHQRQAGVVPAHGEQRQVGQRQWEQRGLEDRGDPRQGRLARWWSQLLRSDQ